jgi:hypothetical protein
MLSQNAQKSHWVLKELDSAVNCGKVILPFMLEECDLSDEFNFLLTGAQRYSAYQKKAEAMEKLIGRIQAILATDTGDGAPAEPRPAPEQPTVQKAASEKTIDLGWSKPTCPACGGTDLKELPGHVRRHSLSEWMTVLLIPLGVLVGSFAAMLVLSILSVAVSVGTVVTALAVFAGMIGGGIFGNRISLEMVRRQRIRKHIHVVDYRCNSCRKVFHSITDING